MSEEEALHLKGKRVQGKQETSMKQALTARK
jgi:hypothetical protein